MAREVAVGTTEYHWRAAIVHAYYALFLEGRETLFRWGFRLPRRDNAHAWVRLRFQYAANADLKSIGRVVENLAKLRNQASYDLTLLPMFASASVSLDCIHDATDALALLDQIDADPVRRAAATASITP